jgi:hypothetical protein
VNASGVAWRSQTLSTICLSHVTLGTQPAVQSLYFLASVPRGKALRRAPEVDGPQNCPGSAEGDDEACIVAHEESVRSN